MSKKGSSKPIPISKCIGMEFTYQDFSATGHPYWELWNEILHETKPENKESNSISKVNSVNSVNSASKVKETNTNDDK